MTCAEYRELFELAIAGAVARGDQETRPAYLLKSLVRALPPEEQEKLLTGCMWPKERIA